jgi:hypothetical protein
MPADALESESLEFLWGGRSCRLPSCRSIAAIAPFVPPIPQLRHSTPRKQGFGSSGRKIHPVKMRFAEVHFSQRIIPENGNAEAVFPNKA